MGLDARGVTSVIELIFYLPVLLISILLVARHGFKREGWIYLLLLANSDYSVRISTIQAADSVWRSPSDWGNHSYHRGDLEELKHHFAHPIQRDGGLWCISTAFGHVGIPRDRVSERSTPSMTY